MRSLTWNEYVRLALSYPVFSRNEDGSWSVEVPVLPGCVTWGETRAEAVIMVEDAVQGWLVTALRFGGEIPVIDRNALSYSIDVPAGTASERIPLRIVSQPVPQTHAASGSGRHHTLSYPGDVRRC